MWEYSKRLQHPVKIGEPDPAAAKLIMTQLGGPNGEMGASARYLQQRYTMPYSDAIGTLTDIGIGLTKSTRWNGNIFIIT